MQTSRFDFTGNGVVLTLPLGVLQARLGRRGAVSFDPPIRAKAALIAKMGMGHVVRVMMRFRAGRWRTLLPPAMRREKPGGFGFLHSRVEGFPVWWSFTNDGVVAGWVGGPAARRMAARSADSLRATALRALGQWLHVSPRRLREALLGFEVHNWSRDPFSRGAYSFTAAGQDAAARKLRQPIQSTLFFAGEATADDEEVGTVHGALASGLRAAHEVLAGRRRGQNKRPA